MMITSFSFVGLSMGRRYPITDPSSYPIPAQSSEESASSKNVWGPMGDKYGLNSRIRRWEWFLNQMVGSKIPSTDVDILSGIVLDIGWLVYLYTDDPAGI